MIIVQVSLTTCPSAWQVYRILNLHQLGHAVPAAMFRDILKEMLYICQ